MILEVSEVVYLCCIESYARRRKKDFLFRDITLFRRVLERARTIGGLHCGVYTLTKWRLIGSTMCRMILAGRSVALDCTESGSNPAGI